jgi:hypothetical protein
MTAFDIGVNGTSRESAETALYSSFQYTDESVVFSDTETDASNARNSHSDNFTSAILDVFIVIGYGLIGAALLIKANKE